MTQRSVFHRDVASRLARVLGVADGTFSPREIALMADIQPETMRRTFADGQTPSTENLAKLCERFGLSSDWVLTGRGPTHREQFAKEGLRRSSLSDLMNELGSRLNALESLARVGAPRTGQDMRIEPRLDEAFVRSMIDRIQDIAGRTADNRDPVREPEESLIMHG